jgi:Putative ATPase subunit of terminase (gpP-like)
MLNPILDEFTWQRPASRRKGFAWEGAGEDLRLVDAPGAAFTDYKPHPGIFRDFADLGHSPEAVLKFANRYGALRKRREWDTLTFWRTGIQETNRLVRLSDAVTTGDWKKLPGTLAPFLADAHLSSADDLRPILDKQKRGEKASKNEQVHAAVVRLYHAVSPAQRLEVEGSWNAMTERVDLRLKHADLIGFMFFQLGHAFLGGRRFRQCAVCGKWTLLRPGVNRADRTTCSDYCRLRRCRQRKQKAGELHAMGWSPERIAREIGSEVSTVREWLSRAKREQGC